MPTDDCLSLKFGISRAGTEVSTVLEPGAIV